MGRKLGTKEKILRAAVEEFAQHGYQQTTIHQICQRADANIAAVNYHYGSKDELYLQVFAHLTSETREIFQNIPDSFRNENEWREQIRALLRQFINRHNNKHEQQCLRQEIMRREMQNPSPVFDTIYEQHIRIIDDGWIRLIRQGLPANAPDHEVAFWMTAVLAPCFLISRQKTPFIKRLIGEKPIQNNEQLVQAFIDHISGIIFRGLKFRGQ